MNSCSDGIRPINACPHRNDGPDARRHTNGRTGAESRDNNGLDYRSPLTACGDGFRGNDGVHAHDHIEACPDSRVRREARLLDRLRRSSGANRELLPMGVGTWCFPFRRHTQRDMGAKARRCRAVDSRVRGNDS